MTDQDPEVKLSPYHTGEQAVQERLGVRQRSEDVGQRFIRQQMSQQHRNFFAGLRYLFAASIDTTGQPWASILVGEQGFAQSTDEQQLTLNRHGLDQSVIDGDPFKENAVVDAPIGLLGVDLSNRRRNRANGRVVGTGMSMEIEINQSFGNCSKYIQRRQLVATRPPLRSASARQVTPIAHLSAADKDLIAGAESLFIATAQLQQQDGVRSNAAGLDISHRGGNAGFVEILSATELQWPEYKGNNFFNTLGNLQLEPRCGLLFIDFVEGHLLQLIGEARVIWDGDDREQRVSSLRFRVTGGQRIEQGLPFRWQRVGD